MIIARFDVEAFFQALDQVHSERGITWNRLFHETGVQYYHIKRSRARGTCGGQTLITLISWSGLDIREFISVKEAGG